MKRVLVLVAVGLAVHVTSADAASSEPVSVSCLGKSQWFQLDYDSRARRVSLVSWQGNNLPTNELAVASAAAFAVRDPFACRTAKAPKLRRDFALTTPYAMRRDYHLRCDAAALVQQQPGKPFPKRLHMELRLRRVRGGSQAVLGSSGSTAAVVTVSARGISVVYAPAFCRNVPPPPPPR